MRIIKSFFRFLVLMAVAPSLTVAEDIDLFASGLTSGAASNAAPNLFFVIDNTSNWSRESQKWPDGAQAESEARAIKAALAGLPRDVPLNVAIFEFTTRGNASQDGGYVRLDLQSYWNNETKINGILDDIEADYGSPDEKRNSNSSYGNLFRDLHAYLVGGAQTFSGEGTPGLVDPEGYTDKVGFGQFESPLSAGGICPDNYVIFVTNPDSNGPESDSEDNSAALEALYTRLIGDNPPGALAGAASGGLEMPEYFTTKSNKGDANEVSLGYSEVCYADPAECTSNIFDNVNESDAIQNSCSTSDSGCFCSTANNERTGEKADGSDCPGNGNDKKYRYTVYSPSDDVDTGHSTTGDFIDGVDYNLDDWTKFLYDVGVEITVPGEAGEEDETVRVGVKTYTIDVFNRSPSEVHSSLIDSAATQGGGEYGQAKSEADLAKLLSNFLGNIVAKSSAFSAVTLPLTSADREISANKVFVGLFRPAVDREPRWAGNLKLYQIAKFGDDYELADANLNEAINPETGFTQDCAVSFWTSDTTSSVVDAEGVSRDDSYFVDLGLDPSVASECSPADRGARSAWSDSPDGPFVEKGGAAQQIRNQVDNQNDSERALLTMSPSLSAGTPLPLFSAATLDSDAITEAEASLIKSYAIGEDPGLKGGNLLLASGDTFVANPSLDEPEIMPDKGLRSTVHGDVVHSRPVAVNYGNDVVRVFYGANDGWYRSVDPSDGTEDWAVIAYEHFESLERLYRNTPTVDYSGLDDSLSVDIGAEPKSYMLDGPAGSLLEYDDNDKLERGHLFLTMRRGGRRVYALDIVPGDAGEVPAKPEFLWTFGCSSLTVDADCEDGSGTTNTAIKDIGQTWSTPVVGYAEGFDSDTPLIFMGGGWDDCLDVDAKQMNCSASDKGNQIFVLNALTGAYLTAFETDGPVVSDIALVDMNYDGVTDLAYAVTAPGSVYRVSLSNVDSVTGAPTSLSKDDWFATRIAYTDGDDRRFMNTPVVAEDQPYVWVIMGSGDRERPLKINYPYVDDIENRLYAFADKPFFSGLEGSNVDLRARTPVDLDGITMANVSSLSEGDPIDAFDGWYYVHADKEQVVNPAATAFGQVFWNSFTPDGSNTNLCANLGTSYGYRVPLWSPSIDDLTREESGEGIPTPPVITTVKISDDDPSCTQDCGDGDLTDDTINVCIGCNGFEPIEINPTPDSSLREAFRAENIDVQ